MWVFLLMMSLLLCPAAASTARTDAKPGCQDKCGNVSVPYPFGIGEQRCAMNKHFFLNCSSGDELWFGSNFPARNISVLQGTLTASLYTAFACYDKTGSRTDNNPVFHPWIRPLHVVRHPKCIHSNWLRYICLDDQL